MTRRLGTGLAVTLVVLIALSGGLVARSAPARTAASETITVSNTNPRPVLSRMVLDPTHRYRIDARGTVSDWCSTTSCPSGDPSKTAQANVGVDPLYCYAAWRCASPELWRQLQVDGRGLDELAGTPGAIRYSPAHRYVVTVKGVKGALRLVTSDSSRSDNSGAFTVVITDLGGGGGGGGVERFDFRIAYRLKPATTTPPNCVPTPGTVSGHGNAIVLGGTVNGNGLVENEAPFTAGCRTANISMRVLSAELSVQQIGPQRSIRTVHAVVKISGRSGHNGADCYVDTQGTLTVVDSDVLLRPQGLYADSFSLGGWNKPCGGHRHSWSNANPGSVGPGTIDGSFLSVQILCQGRPGGLSARNCDTT